MRMDGAQEHLLNRKMLSLLRCFWGRPSGFTSFSSLVAAITLAGCRQAPSQPDTVSSAPLFPNIAAPDPKIPLQPPQDKYEQDFPFQIACIEAKAPGTNIANKGIAIKLGNDASVCFDTDLLRMSAGWTGKHLNFRGVTFDGGHGGHPMIPSIPKFGTRPGPGWADAQGSFADQRPEPFGPLPSNTGRWDGHFVVGDYVVLSYTVGGTKIYEQPSSIRFGDETGFVRTFRTGPVRNDLTTVLCDSDSATPRIEGANVVFFGASNTVTVIGIANAPKGVSLGVLENSRVVLKLAKDTRPSIFKVVVWQGEQTQQNNFARFLEGAPRFVDFARGGPARWPETVKTKGTLAASTTPDGAYVQDVLTSPDDNPWKRRVRWGGMDFFSDGKRAALSTWDGDVWIVSGLDEKLENLVWKRFASGGFENLGLKIVDDVIYTTGRDQITRYHDLNGDGEADYYENFNNQVTSSPGFHEFPFDLQTDKAGNFYTAKAGPVRAGGQGFGDPDGKRPGNGKITAFAGTVQKISKDGKTREVYATGFRAPNGLGVSPDGQVTAGDNEGTWVPACPVHWLKKGSFQGVEDLAQQRPPPSWNKPLMWFSKNWDNSGGGQVWVTSDHWGPFQGALLHCSYGQSSLYLIMHYQVGGQVQGGAIKIPVKFTSSAMRPRFNPKDGQLYVAGLRGWQSNAAKETGFDRIRYTGRKVYMARQLGLSKNAVEIGFTEPLDESSATDLENYSAKRWNYKRTKEYGSADFSVVDPDKKGRDPVDITGAKLSADGKTLTLQLADLRPVDQLLIKYSIKTKDGTEMKQEVLQTIHAIP